MKRSLRDYQQEPAMPRQQTADAFAYPETPGQIDPAMLGTVQSAVEHYSGKSERELMQELRQYRNAGAFDDIALQDFAARLAPMLTPEQQQRLFSVMQQL